MRKFVSIIVSIVLLITLSGCAKHPASNTNANTINQANSSTTNTPDISSHNSASDCWTIIDSTTYNITDYITSKEHPSGNADLIAICGKDGTNAFNNIRKHSSAFTSDVLNKYKVK